MSVPSREYVDSGGGKANAFESTNRGLFDFGMVLVGNDSAWGFCPICFEMMDMNGATNEHILTDSEYQEIFGGNFAQGDYNADWNLMQAHSRCNSTKGKRGIFQTWRAKKPTGLSPAQYASLITILDNYAAQGKTSIGHFAKGNYKEKLQYIFAVVTSRNRDAVEKFVKQM